MRITGTPRTTTADDGGVHMAHRPVKAMVFALITALLAFALLGLLSDGALARGGHHVRKYWQYDMGTFDHSWKSEATLRRAFKHWLDKRKAELVAEAQQEARQERQEAREEFRAGDIGTAADSQDESSDTPKVEVPRKEIRAYERKLQERYLKMHFHEATGNFSGKATWFNDSHGACGKPLKGYYAASKTLPCGTKVAVRANGRYVHVTILDRGPYTGAVLDLSKSAFRQLAPIGAGVINVKATRLRG